MFDSASSAHQVPNAYVFFIVGLSTIQGLFGFSFIYIIAILRRISFFRRLCQGIRASQVVD